ncbi:DUF3311 domain-containing protein [Actinacidiphila sp. DG2A-62]|jgi:hypothetical protein|uniref:DUF3311 domain-containing protein n=1 Tax=Actinacidiphila sp. DG2A-62 TaxID=3108821 RepID=UPI002DBFA0E5|nr:DUF3311 domain-containing protein [Actinacidiphila sp. DG2A-62]MEC3996896.1 DUF3311 domain-containing protein [Actinacidiphila sp. DG2A-62]
MPEETPPQTATPPGDAGPAAPPVVTVPRVLAGVCLVIPLVALLWVDSYARMTPRFIGIPFFYWYQIAWVPVAAALTYTAYQLVLLDERHRKAGGSR